MLEYKATNPTGLTDFQVFEAEYRKTGFTSSGNAVKGQPFFNSTFGGSHKVLVPHAI